MYKKNYLPLIAIAPPSLGLVVTGAASLGAGWVLGATTKGQVLLCCCAVA